MARIWKLSLTSNRREKRNTRRSRANLNLETMERRDLMTGSVSTSAATVYISGTSASDTAEVRVETQGTSTVCDDKLRVSLNHSGHGHTSRIAMYSCSTTSYWDPRIRRVITIPRTTQLVTDIVFNGYGGNDRMTNNSHLSMRANGGSGNDILTGGTNRDTLTGGSGYDTIRGGGGYDRLVESGNTNFRLSNSQLVAGYVTDSLSSIEAATITGGSGDNTIDATSFGGPVMLSGGWGNDRLLGGSSADYLDGGPGSDVLYGRGGRDTLNGNSGNDGLFGGQDVDRLTGGSGSDRFLDETWMETVSSGWWSWSVRKWEDSIQDADWSQDARVGFQDGGQTTVDFSGQDGSYTYAAASWADSEVELIDSALQVLHDVTDNSRLLKKANGDTIYFTRHGALIRATGSFNSGGWNSGSTIALPDAGFNSTNGLRGVVMHEIGHNWDTEYDASTWRDLSGWTTSNKSGNPNYTKGLDKDTDWWYLTASPIRLWLRHDESE